MDRDVVVREVLVETQDWDRLIKEELVSLMRHTFNMNVELIEGNRSYQEMYAKLVSQNEILFRIVNGQLSLEDLELDLNDLSVDG